MLMLLLLLLCQDEWRGTVPGAETDTAAAPAVVGQEEAGRRSPSQVTRRALSTQVTVSANPTGVVEQSQRVHILETNNAIML